MSSRVWSRDVTFVYVRKPGDVPAGGTVDSGKMKAITDRERDRFGEVGTDPVQTALLEAVIQIKVSQESLFLAGLLHDVGVLFWLRYFPEEIRSARSWAERNSRTILDGEKYVMGVGHTYLGRKIARHWSLPDQYAEVISSHHQPTEARNWHLLCHSVHLADILVQAMELDGPNRCRVPDICKESWQALKLDIKHLPGLMDQIQAEFQAAEGNFVSLPEREKDSSNGAISSGSR